MRFLVSAAGLFKRWLSLRGLYKPVICAIILKNNLCIKNNIYAGIKLT